jgi:hypothetical protein
MNPGWATEQAGSGLGILLNEHTLNANRSPTLANRSLLSAPGNGFQEAETGGAETRKPRASAPPETQAFRNRRAKSLNRPAVW